MARASPLTSGSFGSGSARMRVYLSRYASRSMSRMWHRISRIDHLPGAGVKRSSFFGTPRSASLRAAGVAASVSRWRARSFTMGDVVSGMGGSRLGKWLFRLREEQFLRFEAKEKRVEDERAPLVAARGIEREVRNTPRRECLLDGVVDFPLEREIRVAHAVEARIADDRHLEERVVRRRPAPHEALENGFRRGARERPPHDLAGQWLNGNAADVLEWDSHHDDFAILRRLDRRRGAGLGAELVYKRRERLGVPRIADHHGVAVRHREARDLASDAARADESNRHHEQNMPWMSTGAAPDRGA